MPRCTFSKRLGAETFHEYTNEGIRMVHKNKTLIHLFIFSAALLIFPLKINTLEISWEKIHSKLASPLPDWMQEQIEEDLATFSASDATPESIDATLKNVGTIPSGRLASFVRYRIKNNKIDFETYCDRSDARITWVVEVLEEMATHLGLPDLDFLVSLWDSYDNPLFLEKTHCPVFTMCKKKGNKWGVLYPEFRFFSYRLRLFNDISWTSDHTSWHLKIDKGFWRGMTSGGYYSLHGWDLMPRSRLVLLSKEYPTHMDAAFTSPYSLQNNVKQSMEHYGMFQPWIYPVENIRYKYLISIDGNTFASNLWWQLLSNCAVLKSDSPFIEWFYKGIHAYQHYIPFAPDSSDLKDKIEWARVHDAEARRIADTGQAFGREHLSNEALVVYFYKLLLAYAELAASET